MGRFTLAMMLVLALANPALSCSKSGTPGKPFEIWFIDPFINNYQSMNMPCLNN